MKDLLHYRSHHIDADVWKQLMVAALTGKTEFKGEPLDRQVQIAGDKCKMSWISRLESSIDVEYMFPLKFLLPCSVTNFYNSYKLPNSAWTALPRKKYQIDGRNY
jgi:hypothetical protein